MSKAAGAFSQVIASDNSFVTLKLPSGEVRLISRFCWATIGQVGNLEHLNWRKGKAGGSRWVGRTPKVRGVAMNPCDHPHGGGEGRCPIGRVRPLTPWSKAALGKKSRSPRSKSNLLIIRGRKNP